MPVRTLVHAAARFFRRQCAVVVMAGEALAASLARDLNCLVDSDRSLRRRALDSLTKRRAGRRAATGPALLALLMQ